MPTLLTVAGILLGYEAGKALGREVVGLCVDRAIMRALREVRV